MLVAGARSSDLIDQGQTERMACGIFEYQTMSRIRLMRKAVGAGTLDARSGALEVVDEEIDMNQRRIVGPTRWDVVSNAHELYACSFTAH